MIGISTYSRLKVIYHPLHSMNNFMTNKSNKVATLTRWGTSVSLYGVTGYHVIVT